MCLREGNHPFGLQLFERDIEGRTTDLCALAVASCRVAECPAELKRLLTLEDEAAEASPSDERAV